MYTIVVKCNKHVDERFEYPGGSVNAIGDIFVEDNVYRQGREFLFKII